MKKGMIFALLLIAFAAVAFAQEAQTIPRMTNFMGDNVHIIRVQELSEKLDGQINTLDVKLAQLEARLSELDQIKSNMNRPVEVSTTGFASQLNSINSEISDIKSSVNELSQIKSEIQVEPVQAKQSNTPLFIAGLLAVNAVLLFVTIFTFTARKPKEKPIKTVHEYVARSLDEGVDEHEIKQELLKKGWATKDIENVFEEVKQD